MNMVVIGGFSRSGKSRVAENLHDKGFKKVCFKQIRRLARSSADLFACSHSKWAEQIARMPEDKKAEEFIEREEENAKVKELRDNPLNCTILLKEVLGLIRTENAFVDEDQLQFREFWTAVCHSLTPTDSAVFVLMETPYKLYVDRRKETHPGLRPAPEVDFDRDGKKANEGFPRGDAGFICRIRCRVGLPCLTSVDGEIVLQYDTDDEYRKRGFNTVVETILGAFSARKPE